MLFIWSLRQLPKSSCQRGRDNQETIVATLRGSTALVAWALCECVPVDTSTL